MDSQMDQIISQLSHIENTAVRIVETADAQKKELADEMALKKKTFDEELAAETQERLQAMQERLNSEKEKELSELKSATEKALRELDEKYAASHKKWADEIMKALIQA